MTFTPRTLHQLERLGFTTEPSYLSNCLVIRREPGEVYGHLTEAEAREKLLNERKETTK